MIPCGARGGQPNSLGVGGMATKLEAATTARRAGTEVLSPTAVKRTCSCGSLGRVTGTRFRAQDTPLRTANDGSWRRCQRRFHRRRSGRCSGVAHPGPEPLPAGIAAVEGSSIEGTLFRSCSGSQERRCRDRPGVTRFERRTTTHQGLPLDRVVRSWGIRMARCSASE